jgi:hypothetical protein
MLLKKFQQLEKNGTKCASNVVSRIKPNILDMIICFDQRSLQENVRSYDRG